MKVYWIPFVCLTVCIACKQEYVPDPKPSPTVRQARVETLKTYQQPLPIHASGRVEVIENARLSFKIGGIVQRLLVEEGQTVRPGQVLAQLDPAEIDAQVNQARAQVKKRKRDLERFQRLYEENAATLQSVQDLETALQVAEADLRIATFNQSYSRITAPAAGIVLSKMAEENELVNPGQPIVVLSTSSSGMSLNVGLSDRDVVRVQLGDTALLTLDAYPDSPARATITEIGATAHPRVGTYPVELTLHDFPHPVKNGFFAKAEILPTSQTTYYRIPIIALVAGNNHEIAVYVPQGEQVAKAIVEPLYFGDDFVAVRTQDLPGKSVLTEGAAYLAEGEKFEILH